jgi:hypothetical protein
MSHASAYARRFERFLLGLGMSAMLLLMERRVVKMQRAGNPGAHGARGRSHR